MQLDSGSVSVMKTMAETYTAEGCSGFFKGCLSPLIGMTPYNTMVFVTTETVKRSLTERKTNLSD